MITVGSDTLPWKEGLTIASVLAALEDVSMVAVVRLNGKLVSKPNFDRTPVPDGAEIVLIPMIAGG